AGKGRSHEAAAGIIRERSCFERWRLKMRNYTTQMDAARKGILTPEMKTVAKKERMPEEQLMKLVAEGKVAICANKNHKCLDPEGIGSMLRKIGRASCRERWEVWEWAG